MNKKPEIAFFDMDYTILENDCDVLWKKFLADKGLAPDTDREKADYYLDLHQKGELPVDEYIKFQMKEFTGNMPDKMFELSQQHFDTHVHKFLYPQAKQEIKKLKKSAIPDVLITGTNEVIATPIAKAMDFTDLIATKLEISNGMYTGKVKGDFLIKENKLQFASEYCQKKGATLDDAIFYADSINDLELLEKVFLPITVNPGEALLEIAQARNWHIKNWTL